MLKRTIANCYIIAEWFFYFILSFFVGYILYFGLVRFRTFRLNARVGAHIKRRRSRSRKEDVKITDVIIKTTCWDLNEASPIGSTRCAARGGVRWNSQHSKNCVSLSLCWKPKSQEGNKSFVPELKKVVSVSGFPVYISHIRIMGILHNLLQGLFGY